MTSGAYFGSLQVRNIGHEVFRDLLEKLETFQERANRREQQQFDMARRELEITKSEVKAERASDIAQALREFEIKNNEAREKMFAEFEIKNNEAREKQFAEFEIKNNEAREKQFAEQDLRIDDKLVQLRKSLLQDMKEFISNQ